MGEVKIPPPRAHVGLHTATGDEGNALYVARKRGDDHWFRAHPGSICDDSNPS